MIKKLLAWIGMRLLEAAFDEIKEQAARKRAAKEQGEVDEL